MRKRVCIIWIVLWGFAVGVYGAGFTKLANHGKRGLHIYTIDHMLRLNEDQIDLATGALLLSREWGTKKTIHIYRGKIDDMAHEILKRIKKQRVPMDHRAITVINNYLFRERGFRTVKTAENPNDLFLHNVIDTKRGYCLSLSVLYLSIGERIGLPLYGVVVPGHFFVRYDDGHRRYNIETTSGGGNASDEYYIKEYNVPPDETIYMKNLSKVETIGCFYNNLGNSYMDIGQIDIARSKLEYATAINPSLAESHSNLGNIYLRQGIATTAIREYLAALEIIGEDVKMQANLANAYNYAGNFGASIDEYKRVLKLDSDYIEAYKGLANAYARQGMFAKAILQLKFAIKREPTDGGLYRQMGDVLQENREFEDALVHYQRALWIDRDLVGVHESMGFAYLQTDQADEAVRAFQRAIGEEHSSNAYLGLGQAYNALGNTREAIATYKELLSFDPGQSVAMLNLGIAYVNKKQYDKAIEQYLRGIEVAPEDTRIRYSLGAAYSSKKMYDEAIEQYMTAIGIDPRDAGSHHGLAYNYYMTDERNLAKKHLRIARQLGYKVNEQLVEALK